MKIVTEYEIDDIVYLVTDPDKHARIIDAVMLNGHGIMYRLAFVTNNSWHSEIEFSKEKNYLNY